MRGLFMGNVHAGLYSSGLGVRYHASGSYLQLYLTHNAGLLLRLESISFIFYVTSANFDANSLSELDLSIRLKRINCFLQAVHLRKKTLQASQFVTGIAYSVRKAPISKRLCHAGTTSFGKFECTRKY